MSRQSTVSPSTNIMAKNTSITMDNGSSITDRDRDLIITDSSSSLTTTNSILGTPSSMGSLGKSMDGGKTWFHGNGNGKESNILNKKYRNRRGWGKKLKRKQLRGKQHEQFFTILGSNTNGILGKFDSLKKKIFLRSQHASFYKKLS